MERITPESRQKESGRTSTKRQEPSSNWAHISKILKPILKRLSESRPQ